MVFVIGCGRSGTTLTGEILGSHPRTRYLFEPYHLWAAVDAETDVDGTFTRGSAHCILDEDRWSVERQGRFDRVFGCWEALGSDHRVVVEKSPINSMRIGYLRKLSPGCRFIHLIRDGRAVIRSIERISAIGTYRIAGRNPYNQWWGVADKKWRTLASDLQGRPYFTEDVAWLRDDLARGACEWVASLEEVERWRSVLGDNLLDVRYEALTRDPGGELHRIAEFLGLESTSSWFELAARHVKPLAYPHAAVDLPAAIADPFERWSARLGYDRPPYEGRPPDADGR